MRADARTGRAISPRCAVALAALSLSLASLGAFAASPGPITIDCPAQSVGNRMPTSFAWDGTAFKQVRQDGRTFSRQVTAAVESRRDADRGQRRVLSFQLAPTPGEGSPARRDYIAVEFAPESGKDTVSLYFKMATLESGFLTETLLQHSQACMVSSR
jgi:hypothetical protein